MLNKWVSFALFTLVSLHGTNILRWACVRNDGKCFYWCRLVAAAAVPGNFSPLRAAQACWIKWGFSKGTCTISRGGERCVGWFILVETAARLKLALQPGGCPIKFNTSRVLVADRRPLGFANRRSVEIELSNFSGSGEEFIPSRAANCVHVSVTKHFKDKRRTSKQCASVWSTAGRTYDNCDRNALQQPLAFYIWKQPCEQASCETSA